MKKKTRMKKIVCILFLLLVGIVSILGVYMWMWSQGMTSSHNGPLPCVAFIITENNMSWIITVEEKYGDTGYTNVRYYLENASGIIFFRGNLSDIRNNPCSEYNITWLDKDEDYGVSVGDEFIINKAGGNIGKVTQGDIFKLRSKSIENEMGHVVLS